MTTKTKVTYQAPDYTKDPVIHGNYMEVDQFVGYVPPCSMCNGYGEYDTNFGSIPCMPCNSRLIPFINAEGKRDYIDWGDTVECREDGLHLIKGDFNE